MGRYGYEDRNERIERLLEFATIHNLFICNARFELKPQRKLTWASPDGTHKNIIDLILIKTSGNRRSSTVEHFNVQIFAQIAH